MQVINFVAKGTIEEGMLSVLAFKRSLSAGILDGGSGEISLGGSRLNRFMKEVENVTGRMGESEAVTPAEEVGNNVVVAGDTSPAEDAKVDADIGAEAAARSNGRVMPRSGDPGPDPWLALVQMGAQFVAALGAANDPKPLRIPGSNAIRLPACGASKCRCRRRRPCNSSPRRFQRSRPGCDAALSDGSKERRSRKFLFGIKSANF